MADQVVLPAPDKGQTADTALATPVGEKVNEYDEQMLKNLANPKEALKHFKEIQGFASRVSNEKKALEEENAAIKEQLAQHEEAIKFGQPVAPYVPGGSGAPSQGYYTEDDLEKWATTREIKKVASKERIKDIKAFPQRWGMVLQLGQEFPHLTYSGEGVEELFKKADVRLKDTTRDMAFAALDQPEMQEKIREIVSGKPATVPSPGAYMPDSTTSTRTGPTQTKKKDYDAEIKEAKSRGDYNKVSELVIEKQLNT